MILTKTPFRISFAGGGSDYFGSSSLNGQVISATINKYIYIMINKKHDNKIRISYSKTESVNNVNQIKHLIIRNCLKYCGITKGIEIIIMADIPSSGSGLGSSSSLTVGLLKALYEFKQKKVKKSDLALKAYHVEAIMGNKKIGLQDHFNAAYGGFKNYIFKSKNKIKINNINLNINEKKNFLNKLSLYYTGINRKADKILGSINKTYNDKKRIKLIDDSKKFKFLLKNKNYNEIGKILSKSWEFKKNFGSKRVQKILNSYYLKAKKQGMYGGKILGAGGGGYFLFISDNTRKKSIKKVLNNLEEIKFNFSKKGSEVVYNDQIW